MWLCPRIIVSKSHGNMSMYVDTVINFAKITTYIHTHTTYILHTTYYVQNQWSHSLFLNYVQARQKKRKKKKKEKKKNDRLTNPPFFCYSKQTFFQALPTSDCTIIASSYTFFTPIPSLLYIHNSLAPTLSILIREDIQVIPQSIVACYTTLQDQITFLFLLHRETCFMLRSPL